MQSCLFLKPDFRTISVGIEKVWAETGTHDMIRQTHNLNMKQLALGFISGNCVVGWSQSFRVSEVF